MSKHPFHTFFMHAFLAIGMFLFVGHSLTPHAHECASGHVVIDQNVKANDWYAMMGRLFSPNLGSGHLEHVSTRLSQDASYSFSSNGQHVVGLAGIGYVVLHTILPAAAKVVSASKASSTDAYLHRPLRAPPVVS